MARSVPAPYLRPATLAEALDALAEGGEPRLVVAGATDHYPAHATRPIDRTCSTSPRVDGLRGIERLSDGGWRIGALDDVDGPRRGGTLPPLFDGLRAAARHDRRPPDPERAGPSSGNVCNASPAADGMPNLLALDAAVELASAARGSRIVPLAAFVTGNRRRSASRTSW